MSSPSKRKHKTFDEEEDSTDDLSDSESQVKKPKQKNNSGWYTYTGSQAKSSPSKRKHKISDEEEDNTAKSSPSKRKHKTSDEEEDTTDDLSDSERPVEKHKQKTNADDLTDSDIPVKKPNTETKVWLVGDLAVLVDRVNSALPKPDSVRYTAQCSKLDWEAISFSSYSPEDCRQRFMHILEKVRHNQTLTQLVESATYLIKMRPRLFKETSYSDLPKKPLTSYFHFMADKRQKLKASHPELSNLELTRLLSEKFKNLSTKKKKKYIKMAQVSKEEYNTKMSAFKTEHPEFGAKGKYSDAPKMPTPLALYTEKKMDSIREAFPEDSVEHCKAMCKDMWVSLKSKKKLRWIRKAAAAWPQFVEEMAAYVKKYPSFPVRPQNLFTVEEQQLKDRDDGKPPKPPRNGFNLFMREGKEHGDGAESLPELRERWKNVDKEQRKIYSDQAKQAQGKYSKAYQDYLERVGDVQYSIGKKSSISTSKQKNQFTKIKTCSDDDTPDDNGETDKKLSLFQYDEEDKKVRPTSKQTVITNYITGNNVLDKKDNWKMCVAAPPKPVKSAYQLFCKNLLKSLIGIPTKERMQEAARRWKEVTPEEKQELQEKVKKLKLKYQKKLQPCKEVKLSESEKDI